MAELNHTIVWCTDKKRSSEFLAHILGLPPPRTFLHFLVVDLANGASLDYFQKEGPVSAQHYAFLVSDEEFDAAFDRIASAGLDYWADPGRTQPSQVNRHWGGRGIYFADPDNHLMELITKPYGPEAEL
jgi:catechol 2,3-dioxygenase-like lactoylglutathione lyase family enzyme